MAAAVDSSVRSGCRWFCCYWPYAALAGARERGRSRKEYVNRRLLTPRLASDLNALGDEAQSLDSSKRNSDLATRLIKNVALEGQLWHLLTRLSLNYDIPIGVEISSDEQLSNNYRVELSEGTIADLMGQIIKQNEQYDWLIENGVVNIFPRDKYRNAFLAELLKVRIGSFAVTQNSDCWKFEDDLVNTPGSKGGNRGSWNANWGKLFRFLHSSVRTAILPQGFRHDT